MFSACKITNKIPYIEKKCVFLVFFAKNIWFFAKKAVPLHTKYEECLTFISFSPGF